MTARDDAIEAGAKAYWTEQNRQLRVNGADNLGMVLPEWEALSADTQGVERRHMAKVIDEVMPIIQARIDEIEAKAWHRGWHAAAEEIAEVVKAQAAREVIADAMSAMYAAERIAREIGGAS